MGASGLAVTRTHWSIEANEKTKLKLIRGTVQLVIEQHGCMREDGHVLFIVRASPVRTLVRGDMNSPWLARRSANWISKVRFEGLWGMINIMQTQVRRRIHRKNCAKDKPRYKADVEGLTEDMAGVLSRD